MRFAIFVAPLLASATASSALAYFEEEDEEVAPVKEVAEPAHPEARLYDATIDATAAVNAAMTRAAERDVNVIIVLGANWCHDSRAFAGWSETDRIGGLIADQFELVFINVGMPQSGDGHNAHIMRRFRFEEQVGTPMVIVTTPDGEVLNRETAQSWRNTASRSEDEIYAELSAFAEVAE